MPWSDPQLQAGARAVKSSWACGVLHPWRCRFLIHSHIEKFNTEEVSCALCNTKQLPWGGELCRRLSIGGSTL